MSAPTLVTFPGTGALARAHSAWGMNAEADEADWHRNFNETMDRLEASAPVVSDVPADPLRDWKYWRKRQNTELKRQLEAIRCRK